MSFVTLPPEINSWRMYAGLGSGPMVAAAATWEELAAELEAAASSFGSAASGLTGELWRGAAAVAMTTAAAPYLDWLVIAAAQAGRAAAQAKAAVDAYEAAVAATVHPATVAANR